MASLIVRRLHGALLVLVTALGVGIAVQPVGAVKVRVEFDKMFDFSQVRTWAWNANAGQVVLARTRDDDPDAFKKRAEPVILDAVNMEMPRRGLKPATGTPDVTLIYYLLLTVGSSAQTLGQFLPSTAQWGLPLLCAIDDLAVGDSAGLARARRQREREVGLEGYRRGRDRARHR